MAACGARPAGRTNAADQYADGDGGNRSVHDGLCARAARRAPAIGLDRQSEYFNPLIVTQPAIPGHARAFAKELVEMQPDFDVDPGHLRSRTQPLLSRHRQSAARARGQEPAGDNLYTCTIVALNPITGKMAWHYQVTPHDTHDWDAAQTPILIDGDFGGRPRKMLVQASRNGHFFVLDRVTGEHLLTSKFIDSLNWTKGLNANGQPTHDDAKDASVPGTLVSPDTNGATNWPPPVVQSRYRSRLLRHAPDVQRPLPHRHRRPSAGMGRRRASFLRRQRSATR